MPPYGLESDQARSAPVGDILGDGVVQDIAPGRLAVCGYRANPAPGFHVVGQVHGQQQPRGNVARVLERFQGLVKIARASNQAVANPYSVGKWFAKIIQDMKDGCPRDRAGLQHFAGCRCPGVGVIKDRAQGFDLIDKGVVLAGAPVRYLGGARGLDRLQPRQRLVDCAALGFVRAGRLVYRRDASRGVPPAGVGVARQRQVGANLVGGRVVRQ